MPIHTPHGTSYPEYDELADRVAHGDGLGWQGDDRMWLDVEQVRRSGKTGHRLRVLRWCEDGSTQVIGTWHPSELYRVCSDLATMRVDRPGGGDVLDRIDAHNDRLDRDAAQKRQENMIEKTARGLYDQLRREGAIGRRVFTVPGLRDS